MSSATNFERTLRDWFEETAATSEPLDLVAGALERTSRTRPDRRWLAMLRVRPMATEPAVLVGSPTLRLAVVLAAAVLLTLATVGLAGMVPPVDPQPRPGFAFIAPATVPRPSGYRDCDYEPSCIGWFFGNSRYLFVQWPRTRVTQLQEVPGNAVENLAWSPTGMQIAFLRGGGACSELMLVSADDPRARPIGRADSLGAWPAIVWSPTGDRLAVTYNRCGGGIPAPGIYLHELGSGALTRVADASAFASAFAIEEIASLSVHAWRPGSETLLVSAWPGGFAAEEAWLLALSGQGTPMRMDRLAVPEECRGIRTSGWSPDGSRLLIETGDDTLCVGAGDGSGMTLLTGNASNASWSPDGTTILYDQVRQPDDVGIVTDDPIMTIGADGSNELQVGLARGDAFDLGLHPRWSPDGRVYWSDAAGTWSVLPDGTDLTLTEFWPAIDLVWAPDVDR